MTTTHQMLGENEIIVLPPGWKPISQASPEDESEAAFLRYFHAQKGVNPAETNHSLVKALFNGWNSRSTTHKYLRGRCERNTGFTTTFLHFIDWHYFQTAESTLYITHNADSVINKSKPWLIAMGFWNQLRGIRVSQIIVDETFPRRGSPQTEYERSKIQKLACSLHRSSFFHLENHE